MPGALQGEPPLPPHELAPDATPEEVVNPNVNPAVEHTTPDHGLPFPIVAAGASAGGVEAFTALLKALPTDTGMAFVMVQHLSPTHSSMLTEILGRATKMPVLELKGATPVEPNHVYVIPPNKSLVFGERMLQLGPRLEVRGQSRPIDHFMRSLAEEHGHKAIGIVLSGTASDGTLGLQEIKAAGGITFAQDDTAEQTSMPRSAVHSGCVDFVLPPEEIARELGRIARHPYVAPAAADPSAVQEPAFTRVVEMLRQGTGVDFGNYKKNTLHRRITRRMVLHKLDGLRDYLRLLQSKPEEVNALYQDVLINVTSFFRNPEAYEALKTVFFHNLVETRERHDPLRVWTLGCSTGEEAYSLAIAYTEFAEATGKRVPMQIFATDLNGLGIDRARSGIYTKGIIQDVSPERLRRFFVEVDGSYRIAKPIRDMCVFARQNALADPPFSRLDLVACRNMLIYLEPVLQQRLIPLLHYSLRQDGYLWLGGSETIGSYRDLFDLNDAKNKIYQRKRSQRVLAPALPTSASRWSSVAVARNAAAAASPLSPESQKEADRVLLARYAPPGVLLDEDLDVIQFRGDTGPYLAPAPGRATLNFLKMLREGLLVAVRGALHKARREKTVVREEGLRVRSDGGWREVDLVVMPVRGAVATEGAYLVLFEEPAQRVEARARELAAVARAAAEKIPASHDEDSQQEVTRLKQELSATREYLQSVIEQQEAANEELQSANEEVQSANEELQSINEELETSKEEIQSANEELATVNDELQNRNNELSQTNDDLTNLLSSVNMAIVMLGPDLRIRRFTQTAEKVLNLIPPDVGRPIADIKLNIDVPDLEALIVEVIETVATREREVRDRNDRWYSLRIRPYRTMDHKIDGAVLMLVDIDHLKRAEHSLRESEQRFELLADSAPVLIWVNDLEGCRFVNRAFEDFVGEPESEIRRGGLVPFIHPDDRAAYVDAYAAALRQRLRFEARTRLRRADGTFRWMKLSAMPRLVPNGQLIGYVGSSVDITDMAEAEAALMELDQGKNEFLALLAHELRNPLSGVRNAARLLGDSRDETIMGKAREIIDRQTAHMARLIDDLLDVARITYGKIQLNREPVDLVAVLNGAVDSTDAERRKLQQQLAVSLPPEPLMVHADPLRLDQIFTNLLVNASKFTRAGGRVWLSAEKEPTSREGPACVTVRVRDNGIGIDPSFLPRIFDLFVQATGSADHSRTGIGLGLTLAKRLVGLHGGTIEALSAGKSLGSEFVVRLPLGEASSAPSSRPARTRIPVTGRRVLIIDDNRDSADSLRLVFASAGHEVRIVYEGVPAVSEAVDFKPEVVILDIGLPDMDGYQVARDLRAHPQLRDLFIVAVTGFGRESDRARSIESGIDIHMTKPVDLDALLDCIVSGQHGAERKP
ncbi:MAG TPA: chemotaxis protein CheB [Usitatibacter sp.]|nr:chemotaxis protein CheB [Usitatibacter sp.]